MLLRLAVVLAVQGSLTACYYRQTYYPDVIVRGSVKFKYEVQLRRHIEGRGNMHTLSLSKFGYDTSSWLYLDTITGTVGADALVFTRYWACLEYPWSSQKLKGYVEFKGDQLVIALEGPWYEDGKTLSGYRPLDANGVYSVKFENAAYRPNEIDLDGPRCDRSAIRYER